MLLLSKCGLQVSTDKQKQLIIELRYGRSTYHLSRAANTAPTATCIFMNKYWLRHYIDVGRPGGDRQKAFIANAAFIHKEHLKIKAYIHMLSSNSKAI